MRELNRLTATVALMAVCCAGCATGEAQRRVAVAVLPLDAVGASARQNTTSARRAVSEALSRNPRVELVEPERVEQIVEQHAACGGRRQFGEHCAARVGAEVGASQVVSGALGGLGRTFLVQLKVVDVARGVVTRSVEEAHYGGANTLGASVARVTDRLYPPPSSAWYRRWWVWAIVGGTAAAATAVALPLALRDDDPYEPVSLP